MIKHRKYAVKFMITALIISLCVHAANQLLIYKLYADQDYATSSTFMNFYDIKEDTIDVLFLGSSHAVDAFIPQELYEEYGITSYNFGSTNQSVALSYYLLKETLRFQQPQAVVIDAYFMFSRYDDERPLNSTEDDLRPAMDHMKWSPVKLEAILDLCMLDTFLDPVSFLLPNIRYHYRWKELGEDDFKAEEKRWQDFKFGYEMFGGSNDLEYHPLIGGAAMKPRK